MAKQAQQRSQVTRQAAPKRKKITDEQEPLEEQPPLVEEPGIPPTPQQLWSNETVPQSLDREMATPTPREQQIANLAKLNAAGPQSFTVINKNVRSMRVIHNYYGEAISIPPGETRQNVLLHPAAARQLARPGTDLELS